MLVSVFAAVYFSVFEKAKTYVGQTISH